MSDYYKPSEYTPWQNTTQWLNNTVQTHDMFCWCDKPWQHLLQSLLQRGSNFNLSDKEKRILQKCLISMAKDGGNQKPESTEDSKKDDTDFDLGAEDLEKLFAEEDTG